MAIDRVQLPCRTPLVEFAQPGVYVSRSINGKMGNIFLAFQVLYRLPASNSRREF